eukprot:gene227-46464_t
MPPAPSAALLNFADDATPPMSHAEGGLGGGGVPCSRVRRLRFGLAGNDLFRCYPNTMFKMMRRHHLSPSATARDRPTGDTTAFRTAEEDA